MEIAHGTEIRGKDQPSFRLTRNHTIVGSSVLHERQPTEKLLEKWRRETTFGDLRDLAGRRMEQEPLADGHLLGLFILVLLPDPILHPCSPQPSKGSELSRTLRK
jgi:hypothetical protein